jgi:hypothetical protein
MNEMARVAGWVVASVVLLSFFEHFVHRAIMHRRGLAPTLYRRFAFLDGYWRAHAVLHHATYYRRFNFEPDPVGREIDMRLGLQTAARLYAGVAPAVLLFALAEPLGAVLFSALALTQMYAWGLVHHEMHVPASRFLQRRAVYRFLARYHFLHHRYPACNLNVVNPLADIVLGTIARPKLCDVREMIRLGYLRPRNPRTPQRLGCRPEVLELPAGGGQRRNVGARP